MKSQNRQTQVVFFLAGFLLGIIYIYVTGDEKGEGVDLFSAQNLMQFQYQDVVYEDYLAFLLRKRIVVLAVMVVLSLAVAGKYLLSGFLMLFGCSMGSMLAVLILRYGWKGMILFFALIFPQDFVYLPVVFGWVAFFAEWNDKLFGERSMLYRRGAEKRKNITRCFLLFAVTIIGIVLECYVNPLFVKYCLKIF